MTEARHWYFAIIYLLVYTFAIIPYNFDVGNIKSVSRKGNKYELFSESIIIYIIKLLERMIFIFLSNYINANCRGHEKFEFVDVWLKCDNKLFIDPCMIERGTDRWSVEAHYLMTTYFDELFNSFKAKKFATRTLLAHAGEQNATKLGYGNGTNGKGKTELGLFNSLNRLPSLLEHIPTINRAQDVPVLIDGFAEDCMSDLLTNIFHELLNRFTEEQMKKWGCQSQGSKSFWSWNAITKSWEQVVRPCWKYDNKEILMVPKWFVRKNFLFNTHQYLFGVIIERMREEQGLYGVKKIDIWNNIARDVKHWEYDKAVAYTKEHPKVLEEYHTYMGKSYNRVGGCMTDEDLDKAMYRFVDQMGEDTLCQ